MRIVIDGRLWSESGLGRYIRNLVLQLQELDTENEYFILHLQKDFKKINYSNPKFQKVLANFKWYGISEQIKLPLLLKHLKPDLVHFPHFNVPILYKGKFVVTIHDLIHEHFQLKKATTHNFMVHALKKFGYHKIFKNAVLRSQKIVVPSDFVKKQLVSEYGVSEKKIIITYEAVDEAVINLSRKISANDFIKLSQKFDIKKPYLFYVGNAHPHKNLSRLISVFKSLKEENSDLQLVLSGSDHHFWEEIKKKSHPWGGIIFTGFILERELVTLYKNAVAFVMPSLEEGFGIPILEAMACSCPVVSSNAGSLLEVGGPPAGGAVLYFDPECEEDMIEKIHQVLSNEKLRKELINKGEKRYKEFSWQKLAKKTLEIYQQS